jgi:serine/threonine protein kinase
MTLLPGTRFGPYEVTEQIGAGGMGEVYRARDTKLNRDVALKVLPDALASDPDRVARFRREAQALASLNHPNIVTIYSVEEVDTHFFVTMELVSGRSLADVLPRNGFAIEQLLRIAVPLVDAVAAAHQKGITHRDLKPANIMLGMGEHDGRVKVLDFGLARLAHAQVEPAAPTASSTMTLTGDGRIGGTVAYMSPEQAEGKPLDSRSDLFSLGVILYEMATGRRPFTGDTNLSILSSLIKDTPPSVTEFNPVLPRDLARVIRRALIKNPDQRYQTAIDLRSDLEDLKDLLQASTSVARRRSRAGAYGAAAVALVMAAAIYVLVASRPTSELSLEDLEVTRLTTSGNAMSPAVSPDGRFVAYVRGDSSSNSSLWIRQVAGTGDLPLVSAEPGVLLECVTVTPDGNSVDYLRIKPGEGSALWRVPLLGGTPKRILDNVQSGIGWSPDGKSMAFVRRDFRGSDSLILADAEGRGERVLASRQWPSMFPTTALHAGTIGRPSWSVDGRLIALAGFLGGPNQPQVVVVNAATGREEHVTALLPGSAHLAAWLDPSSLLLDAALNGTTSQFWKLSYPAGKLDRLTNDLSNYEGISLTADRDVLATARRDANAGIWVTDASGGNAEEVIAPNPFLELSVSWAGDRLVLLKILTGLPSVAIADPNARSGETIVVTGNYPTGTSGGKAIVYAVLDPERAGLWKVDVDGRQPMRLAEGSAIYPVVTPDDRWVVFLSIRSGVLSPWIVSIDGGEPSEIINEHVVPELSVSRDGRMLLFRRAEAGTLGGTTAVICALPRCAKPKTVTIPHHFTGIRWTPDESGIAYLDATMSNIWIQPLDGSAPRQLTHFKDNRRTISFAWSPDGSRLAVNRFMMATDVVLFKGLKR